jgi:hypothetical protein
MDPAPIRDVLQPELAIMMLPQVVTMVRVHGHLDVRMLQHATTIPLQVVTTERALSRVTSVTMEMDLRSEISYSLIVRVLELHLLSMEYLLKKYPFLPQWLPPLTPN